VNLLFILWTYNAALTLVLVASSIVLLYVDRINTHMNLYLWENIHVYILFYCCYVKTTWWIFCKMNTNINLLVKGQFLIECKCKTLIFYYHGKPPYTVRSKGTITCWKTINQKKRTKTCSICLYKHEQNCT